MTDLRSFKIKLSSKGIEKEYEMKEAVWIDDMSLQMQCVDKDGNLILRELWIKRLAIATGKPESEIRKLPHWELGALTVKWMEINEADSAIFLEIWPSEKKNS